MDGSWSAETGRLLDRAGALLRARRVRESLELYDLAVARGVDPLAVGGERWMAHMLMGAFERAWSVSDLVLARSLPADRNRADQPFHRRAVWDGTPLDGRPVLVRCYHGLGDIVQFARYLPLVAHRAAGLVVQAPPAAHGLLAPLPGLDALLPLDGTPLDAVSWGGRPAPGAPPPVQAELMELPHAFRSNLASLPAAVPYLHAEPARVAVQAARLRRRGRLAVGLAWAAGRWDGGHRSLPESLVARLMDVPGIDWVCLQRGPALDHAAALPFRDSGPRSDDLRDSAAMIRALDLVVSVDTVVAHLAGALGAPVWTLLHHEADWRWMLGRTDSPWYPTMRLWRQPSPGHWDAVVAGLREALSRELPSAAAAGSASPSCGARGIGPKA